VLLLCDLPNADLVPLVERLADVALKLDPAGRILDLVSYNDELPDNLADAWRGELLTAVSEAGDEGRIDDVLRCVGDGGVHRLDLMHEVPDSGGSLPMQYFLRRAGDGELLHALGRDMRPTANLRHQLINAQQALEQDYWRLRQVETRYRRLFDMVGDAVLIVDALSNRVLEANPAATELLGTDDRALLGRPFPRGLDEAAERAVEELLKEIRSVGRGQLSNLLLADGESRVDLVASFLRQGSEERYLVRLAQREERAEGATAASIFLQEALRAAPDAVLLLGADGRIAAVNKSFLSMAQLLGEDQALGQPADRWLGRSSVDLNVLLSNLREHPSVRLFSSTLMPEGGSPLEVEVSACRLEEPDAPAVALFIRDIGRRIGREHPVAAKLPRSIEQVTQRVGRVPLKELVRESTDLIEALCIETALDVTGDNRASAAELLGLSRQSLYAKLRRFNLGGDSAERSD
jgi:transcriptional regulator PpsR